jgi:hypothetical protein
MPAGIGAEETDDPVYANVRNFYKVEQWTDDDQHIKRLLWAGNNIQKARSIFDAEIKREPRGRYTIRQRARVLARHPDK